MHVHPDHNEQREQAPLRLRLVGLIITMEKRLSAAPCWLTAALTGPLISLLQTAAVSSPTTVTGVHANTHAHKLIVAVNKIA